MMPSKSPRYWDRTTFPSTPCSPTARPSSRPTRTAAWSWRWSKKGDADLQEPAGWLAKNTEWVRVFDVIVSNKKDDELGMTEYDNLVRALTTSADQFVGWIIFDKRRVWINHPGQNVKMHLQSKGLAKDAAETVMGTSLGKGWKLVDLPFLPRAWKLPKWRKRPSVAPAASAATFP